MKIFTWAQRFVVYGVTLSSVAIFALIGWGIGSWIGQSRAGIFIAVLISYPFTQWALIKRVRQLHKQERQREAVEQ